MAEEAIDLGEHGLILEAEITNCVIEIYLNRIPVSLAGQGAQQYLSLPVHEYLIDGTNELAVMVNPGDTPAKSAYPSRFSMPAWGAQPPRDPAMDAFLGLDEDDDETTSEAGAKEEGGAEGNSNGASKKRERAAPSFTASLSLYPVDSVAGDPRGVPLIRIEWSADDFPALRGRKILFPLVEESYVGPQLYPIWLTKEENLGPLFGQPRWLEARRLTLDEATIGEAREFVTRIGDLIERGDAEAILDISADKYSEIAAAYRISAEERADIFRYLLAEESGKEDWLMETLEDEDFSFRLCAGERLIECTGQDWRPLVRGIIREEGRFLYPMLIGKIEDQWLILR